MNSSLLRRAIFAAALVGGGLVFCQALRADDPTPVAKPAADDASGPEAVFKDKGLVKVGYRLVLPIEAEVHDTARSLKTLQGKQKVDTNKVKKLDEDIKKAKQTLHDMDAEYQKLNDAYASSGDREEKNQLVAQINSLVSKTKSQSETVDGLVADKKKLTDGKEAYVDAVVDAQDKIENAPHAYDDLTSDADLTAAIDKANETAKPKLKLGPSPTFTEDLAFIIKCKSDITMVVVPVTTEHGVPEVSATVNGKKEQMVWDSGASMVLLSSAIATEVGLHPTDKDPTIICKLADGKEVKCKAMSLKSITVGAFTVNDVDCAVMPPDMTDVECLLGDSFQNHFMSKLDQTAGQLRLTPLDTSTVKGAVTAKAAPAKKD
jgi:clan AA aspartic protease (TIGR02281 family)